MLHNLATGKGNRKGAMPPCPCGCRATNHIHASIAHRIAPTGVVHHQGETDRFWKLHRLDTKRPHHEAQTTPLELTISTHLPTFVFFFSMQGHWMDDLEILYTFCCYDEAPPCEGGPRLPLPKTLRWETFLCQETRDAVEEAIANDATIDLGLESRLVRFPVTLGHDAYANACRYDDGVVLAMRVNGTMRVFPFRVVGTAPAVGVFVCTACRAIPELGVQQEEPLFAAAANIAVVGRGPNWPGPPWSPDFKKMTWEQVGWFVSPHAFPGPYPKTDVTPLVCLNQQPCV